MNITYSTWELPVYQVIGPRLRVHWDYGSEEVEDQEGELRTQYYAKEVVLPVDVSRRDFIKAIEEAGGPAIELANDWFTEPGMGEDEKLEMLRDEAELSRLDFMLGIERMGMFDAIQEAMNSGNISRSVRIMWENAATFERNNPVMISMADQLGIAPEVIDQLFGIRP